MSTYDHDMINRYVDGEMTAAEIQAFEQQMLNDDELKKEVELYKEVNQSLKNQLHPDDKEPALRHTMDNLRSDYFKSARVVPIRKFSWVAVAAAAAIVIAVMIWSPWSQPDLYRQYASIEMTSFAERGIATDSLVKQATEKFNKKAFTETLPLFESLLRADSANAYLRLNYGVALLETEQIEKSRTQFTQLYNGSSIFRYDAAFFMALSHLKEKDKANCIQWLNRIPGDASVSSKARELLNKL